MKKFLSAIVIISANLCASQVNLKYYENITIDHNYDDKDFAFMFKFMTQHPQKDVKIIKNPKFTCLDAGFSKKEMYQNLVLYGKIVNGKLIQSEQKGGFKAEHAKKYFKKTAKGEATCVEIFRYKGSEHYGSKNYAILRDKR